MLDKLSKFNRLASGFFIGITASLRPPFILVFIPFIIYRQYSFLLGGIVGILFGLSLSFTVVDIFIWKQYILTMLGMTGFINLNKYLPISNTVTNTDIVYPGTIEGINTIVKNPLEINFSNSSIYDRLYSLNIQNKSEILTIGFVIAMTFLALYLIRYNSPSKNVNVLSDTSPHSYINFVNLMFLFGTLMCLIGEFFIPVGRYPYYDIQLIVPLFIIITQANVKQLIHSKSIAILLAGLLLSVGCFNWIHRFLMLSSYLITFYITLTSLVLARQQKHQKKV